ncbi:MULTISPECIES: hypothetical protein [Amycolatopsis]|uniref:Uncharacterized protein n=1 Tax=Amycolatopsis albidoflavus TaxID=102226 RepID=A0ABW5IAK1_9PSEU
MHEVFRQNFAAMLGVIAIVGVLFALGFSETVLGFAARTSSFVAGLLVGSVLYLLFVQRIGSARRRLLGVDRAGSSPGFTGRPRAASPSPSPSPFGRVVRPYLADPGLRRRRVAGVVWARVGERVVLGRAILQRLSG